MTFSKFAIVLAAVLIGMTLFLSDEAIAGGSGVVITRPGFDDDFGRVVVVRERPFFPFFNPFLFDDDFFFEEEEEEFFEFEDRPFFFDDDRRFFGEEEDD